MRFQRASGAAQHTVSGQNHAAGTRKRKHEILDKEQSKSALCVCTSDDFVACRVPIIVSG
jgi:hypothetical protein